MFSGNYDLMTLEEQIEESGLPSVGEFDMPQGSLGGLHGFKLSTVANVVVGAAAGYSQGGYAGAAAGAVGGYAASKQKKQTTGGKFPVFQPPPQQQRQSQIQIGPDGTVYQTYDPNAPNYIGPPAPQFFQGGGFFDQNPWVLYVGGGLVAGLVVSKVMKK